MVSILACIDPILECTDSILKYMHGVCIHSILGSPESVPYSDVSDSGVIICVFTPWTWGIGLVTEL